MVALRQFRFRLDLSTFCECQILPAINCTRKTGDFHVTKSPDISVSIPTGDIGSSKKTTCEMCLPIEPCHRFNLYYCDLSMTQKLTGQEIEKIRKERLQQMKERF